MSICIRFSWVRHLRSRALASLVISGALSWGLLARSAEALAQQGAAKAADSSVADVARRVPRPLSEHPGNVFLRGETLVIPVPNSSAADRWHWIDIDGKLMGEGDLTGLQLLTLGQPAIGWYRIEFLSRSEVQSWTTAAVLEPLQAPTPSDSPICVDGAIAWFARDRPDDQRIFANLAALAGVNWIRDRLKWAELQTGPEEYASRGNYDVAAEIQRSEGLQILQTFHSTPRWASPTREGTARFAPDLRCVYQFARNAGSRFSNRVLAWEPWNEPNAADFGGHTLDEICAWQKAAWLGFRASGAKTLMGFAPLAAVPTEPQTAGVLLNEVWPYFDTYNIHTYDWANSYAELWAPARAAAGGKPLWITEADRGAQHDKEAPGYELPPALERRKAEYLPQSYASALAAGADRFFQFVLGNYQEPSGVQFGLLRIDHTPRPAYVALAAAGRFLAGARFIGEWAPTKDVHVVGFRARPDGVSADVLVVWTEPPGDWADRGKATAELQWPASLGSARVYDYLGRERGGELPRQAASAPQYVVLGDGQSRGLPLAKRASEAVLSGKPSQVVLQPLFSAEARSAVTDRPWSVGFAYGAKRGERLPFSLCAYNFSKKRIKLEIQADKTPEGWSLDHNHWRLEVGAGERASVPVEVRCATNVVIKDVWITVRGRSAGQVEAVAAFRVLAKE